MAKITWKRTQKINPKSDNELVKTKREEINNTLSKNKAGIESGETIVFSIDKFHLLYGDINGYAWGLSNTRIEVPITNQKNRQTYLGALNYQTKQFHAQGYESGDGKSTVEFIKYLQDKYKGRRIILIWDGSAIIDMENLKIICDQLMLTKNLRIGRLLVFYLLPMLPNKIQLKIFGYNLNFFYEGIGIYVSLLRLSNFWREVFTKEQKFDFPKIHQYTYT